MVSPSSMSTQNPSIMISHYNLSLFYACQRWLSLQKKYLDSNDTFLLAQMRDSEIQIRRIVEDIEAELQRERLRVDPLN